MPWKGPPPGPHAGARVNYNDDAYMGLVEKAHDVGRQVSQLPGRVSVVQSEIENFPYQKLRKSVTVTLLEAAAHMAAGATGPAFNIIGSSDPLSEYLPFLDAIETSRPFLNALREATGRSPAVGVWPAWNRDVFANHGTTGDWLRQRMRASRHFGRCTSWESWGCRSPMARRGLASACCRGPCQTPSAGTICSGCSRAACSWTPQPRRA